MSVFSDTFCISLKNFGSLKTSPISPPTFSTGKALDFHNGAPVFREKKNTIPRNMMLPNSHRAGSNIHNHRTLYTVMLLVPCTSVWLSSFMRKLFVMLRARDSNVALRFVDSKMCCIESGL